MCLHVLVHVYVHVYYVYVRCMFMYVNVCTYVYMYAGMYGRMWSGLVESKMVWSRMLGCCVTYGYKSIGRKAVQG